MLSQTTFMKVRSANIFCQAAQFSSKKISMSPVSFIVFLIIILSSTLLLRRRKSRSGQLPPGPRGWPIFGNIFQLGSTPHRSLTDLRTKYGDVIWLKLGTINTMVVLSAKAATDLFKNHDLSFADRKTSETMRVHDYHKSSMALSPYGPFWRTLRRLATVDIFVTKRINETVSIRRKCINNMLLWIGKEAAKGEASGIQVARFVFLAAFNSFGNLALSRDLLDPDSKDGADFFTVLTRLMEWSGTPNIADFFPFLRWLDPQGLRKKAERDLGKALEIVSRFVKERVEEKKRGNEKTKDFLDVLLEFEGNGKDEPGKFSEKDIVVFILEMFMAGSETTSSSIEWALSELLRNPEILNKAKAELAQVVGSKRMVEESDIANLPYLQAVIKETLRLHSPAPLLVPRSAIQDTKFHGYHIPKNTQVLVNAWAIGRDPNVWNDPLSFKPERFLDTTVDYKGQHYELIPFGAGRRMCVGVPLGHRMLHLLLGSLLHEFDWELGGNVSNESMNMKDRLGITIRKIEPPVCST